MSGELRPYAEADESRVVELSLAAWEPVFASCALVLGSDLNARVYPDWRAHQSSAVQDALQRNETWVSVDDRTISGFVNVIFDEAEDSGEIYMIAVDPGLQRRGIASRLTDFAVAEMIRRGLSLATVATGGDPGHAAARATYEKAGFTPFPQVWYAKLIGPGQH